MAVYGKICIFASKDNQSKKIIMKKLLLSLICLSFIAFTTQAQIVNIPDANFKAALINSGVDLNSDGNIQVSEAEAKTSLDVSSESIASLIGIEAFINLIYLDCADNQLTTLDVSNDTALTTLDCISNQLTTLDVSMNTALTELRCDNNPNLPIICINTTQLGLTDTDSTNWVKDNTATWSTTCANALTEEETSTKQPTITQIYYFMG